MVASGVSCWSCVVGWRGFAGKRTRPGTGSCSTFATGDLACYVAQGVAPASLAVGVLATDVALSGAFVAVSVSGERV